MREVHAVYHSGQCTVLYVKDSFELLADNS